MNRYQSDNDFFSDEISELTEALNKVRLASIDNQRTQIEASKQYVLNRQAQGDSSDKLVRQLEKLTEIESELAIKSTQLVEKMEKQDAKRAKWATNFLTSAFGKIYNNFATKLGEFSRSAFGSTIGLNKGSATFKDVTDTIQKNLGDMVNKLEGMVDTVANTISDASIVVNTRLQGSDKTFQDTYDLMKDALGISPYLKQSDVIKSLQKLANQGIERDLEQRAFLDALSSEIANTFDATNDALQRIVRLQQEDSTAYRMGMEVALTKFLNSNYEDSSYLNSTLDSVTSILVELESQLGREEALDVEFNIQKWLGALYSYGMSDSAITTIAQGLTYLGTGNVNALNSNEGLQRLLTLAITEQGEDYASILLNGLDVELTNSVMEGIVKTLQRFGTTEYSQVVRSQFADLLGMQLSDFTATLTMSTGEMSALANTMASSNNALNDLFNSMNSVGDRMHLSAKLQNTMDNFEWAVGSDIANNTTQYAIWKVNDIVEQLTGGINVPTISVLGSGVDMNANLNQLLKLGMVGLNTLGEIDDIYSGLITKNPLVKTFQKLGGISGGGNTSMANVTASGSLTDMISSAFATDDTKNQIARGSERTLNENIEEHTASIDAKMTSVSDTMAEWNKTKNVSSGVPTYDNNNPAYQTAVGTSTTQSAVGAMTDFNNKSIYNGSSSLEMSKFKSDHLSDDATNRDIVNALNSLDGHLTDLSNEVQQSKFNAGGY